MDADRIKDAFVLAMGQHQKGDLAQAESAYRQILDTAPNHVGSIHNLGLILFQRRDVEAAIAMYRRALEIAPNYDEAHNNLGVALESQGHLDDAYTAYQQALRISPNYATAYNNLGDVLQTQRRLPEAEKAYRAAVRLQPQNPVARVNLGHVFWHQGNTAEAEQAFREALRFEPEYAEAWNGLGVVLRQHQRLTEAAEALRTALRFKGDYPEAYNNLGLILAALGDLKAAKECYHKAIDLDPDHTPAIESLVSSRRFGPEDRQEISRLQTLVDNPNLSESARISLHFALGKMLDDCGSYDQAFSHYKTGNDIKRKTIVFDREQCVINVSETIAAFSRRFFESCHSGGHPSELPVFIVGMPRSGTTLVEQIIASHPQAFGADELPHIQTMALDSPNRLQTDVAYPGCVSLIDVSSAKSLAEDYLEKLTAIDGDALRITDKMPRNYLYIGFIALMFPHARVIHCRRDPLDVCLSIYFRQFIHGYYYAYDLGDIGLYYRQYQRLMQHWHEVLPLEICDVQYEELVANQESESRRLIDYCGLPWDDRCLEYHKNDRPVQSMSNWQVRQPIYTDSIKRWKKYEKYIDELKAALAQEVHAEESRPA